MSALPPVPATIRDLVDVEARSKRGLAVSVSRQAPRTIRQLAFALQRGTLHGAEDVALATARCLEPISLHAKYESLDDLVAVVRSVGAYLQSVQPNEQTIGNTIRRALHSLREDAIEEGIVAATAVQASSDVASSSTGTTPAPVPHAENGSRPRLSAFRPGSTFSISDLVAAGALSQDAEKGAKKAPALPSQADTLSENIRKVRLDDEDKQSQDSESSEKDSLENEAPEGSISQLSSVLLGVAEKLIEDIRGAPQEIGAKYALHHIHSGEVFLTMGYSRTVESFFRNAARQRSFTVFVAESAPDFGGHRLVKALSASHIRAVLVPDSAIDVLMPRVSKVVLTSQLILADGGLVVTPGARLMALSAQSHRVSVVCVAGAYKLCPDPAWISASVWLHGQRTEGMGAAASVAGGGRAEGPAPLSWEDSPDKVLVTQDEHVCVANPRREYLGPDSYDLLITNTGEHSVSLVHLLVAHNYDQQDLVL